MGLVLNNYSQMELFSSETTILQQHYVYITLQSIVQTLPLEEARLRIISLILKVCIPNARNLKSCNFIYNYCVRSDHVCVIIIYRKQLDVQYIVHVSASKDTEESENKLKARRAMYTSRDNFKLAFQKATIHVDSLNKFYS
jgi:hypothetical protein